MIRGVDMFKISRYIVRLLVGLIVLPYVVIVMYPMFMFFAFIEDNNYEFAGNLVSNTLGLFLWSKL